MMVSVVCYVVRCVVYCDVIFCFFLIIRRPPRSTRTDTLFPYTTLCRSLVIVERVGAIGRQRAAPVDSPGPEAARPGAIDEDVVGDLVGQVELVDETRVLGPLVEVGARRSRDDRPGETARDPGAAAIAVRIAERSEEHTSELQSLMRSSYAVIC